MAPAWTFARIRNKAIEQGLLAPDQHPDDAALTDFIFHAGFSTARELTEVAGRGVGMDVVKEETARLGGRIEVSSTPGQGARFRIYLPLTLAVTQALLVRIGGAPTPSPR
jgi:chemosensory pili system protein ChpA (sensor histidine kinase/response regulator)